MHRRLGVVMLNTVVVGMQWQDSRMLGVWLVPGLDGCIVDPGALCSCQVFKVCKIRRQTLCVACRWGLDHPFAGNYQQRLAQVRRHPC